MDVDPNVLLDHALVETNPHRRGDLLEQFFEAVVAREKSIRIRHKHTAGKLGSLDYVITGDVNMMPFKNSPWGVAIECKNWSQELPTTEVEHFIGLVHDYQPCIEYGLLLSTSSLNPSAYDTIDNARREARVVIVPIVGNDLRTLIEDGFYKTVDDCLRKLLFKR